MTSIKTFKYITILTFILNVSLSLCVYPYPNAAVPPSPLFPKNCVLLDNNNSQGNGKENCFYDDTIYAFPCGVSF